MLFLGSVPAAETESAEGIIQRLEQQKYSELTRYLKAHPEAKDRAEAEEALVESAVTLGKHGEALELIRKRYKRLRAGGTDDMQTLAQSAIVPFVMIASEHGLKDEGKAFIQFLREDLKGHRMADEINGMLDHMAGMFAQPSIGDRLDIRFTELNGTDIIDLADFRGKKVVLIDFWATWCGPCVGEIPHVKEAYAKYRDRGFEVVGISLDRRELDLRKFLEKENIKWPQCLDSAEGHGFADKYGIQAIPATFLIGKDGAIVATDLRGDDLARKLEELLPEK